MVIQDIILVIVSPIIVDANSGQRTVAKKAGGLILEKRGKFRVNTTHVSYAKRRSRSSEILAALPDHVYLKLLTRDGFQQAEDL